ncbi:mRNA triphosphatase CET1, partial [Lentinus brumalis]
RQHQHFNILLNKLKLEKPEMNINYEHLHLIDNFYAPESGRGEKLRVTRDEKTGEVRACMRKIRLGNLDIFCPKRSVDWRISVNMEIPVPPPLGSPTHSRKKDRLSYTHQEFAIDLTQVTATSGPNSKPEILHELEVELRHSDYLLMTAAKRGLPEYSVAEQNAFDELVHAFVNNARILCRNANPATAGDGLRASGTVHGGNLVREDGSVTADGETLLHALSPRIQKEIRRFGDRCYKQRSGFSPVRNVTYGSSSAFSIPVPLLISIEDHDTSIAGRLLTPLLPQESACAFLALPFLRRVERNLLLGHPEVALLEPLGLRHHDKA